MGERRFFSLLQGHRSVLGETVTPVDGAGVTKATQEDTEEVKNKKRWSEGGMASCYGKRRGSRRRFHPKLAHEFRPHMRTRVSDLGFMHTR